MAKKKKKKAQGAGSSETPSTSEGTESPRTRAARPARDADARPRAARPAAASAAPSGSANYVVPGLLAVALVAALLWWSRSRNQSAAEPSSPTPSTDRPSGSGSGSGSSPSDRGARERGDNDRGANGGRDNAGQRAQNGEPQRREGVEQEVAPQRAPQNVAVTPTHPRPTSPDPRGGRFTIADATTGMPAGTTLVAEIETSMGTFTCNLLPDRAPISVANFVGLARGHRDFWDPVTGRWTRRAYFDGTVFHRVIPDFMIQGGDILRSGHGGPGYEIPDENTSTHDRAGLLCMANHGPGTNGSQFFITDRATPHLNSSYSVFGECTPTDLVSRIARVPAAGSTPITPVYIQHVRIRR